MTDPKDKIINLDFEQLELNEATMYGQGYDVYRRRASKIFNVAEADVTPEQRRYAKTQLFREIYSDGPPTKGKV